MIRYFFDIRDDRELYRDDDGIESATQREAEMEGLPHWRNWPAIWRGQENVRTFYQGPNGSGPHISSRPNFRSQQSQTIGLSQLRRLECR